MYWGDKCFNFFDGMWAVCIYDIEKNIIVLCRDYMGQKPLYYFHKNEKFCFQVNQTLIFLCEGLKKEINRDAIGQYLLYSHIPAPYSLYKNINQVRAGEIITYNFLNKELKKKYTGIYLKDLTLIFFLITTKILSQFFDKKIKEYKTSDVGFGVFIKWWYRFIFNF